MNNELIEHLKYLRLSNLLTRWDEYLKHGAAKNMSHATWLAYLIEEEYRERRRNAQSLRLKRAQIPEPWGMETYPFKRQPHLDKKKIMAHYDSQEYLRLKQNIIWLGGTGCGKTGLATSFLIQAVQEGRSGRFVLFADLIGELYRSLADHSEEQVLKKYRAYEVLLIDEIGYIEVEPAQVGLFFTLMQRRHGKQSTLITSNLGFSEWGSFLKNNHLTAALVDRLTQNSHIINMRQCRSLRVPIDGDPHDPSTKPSQSGSPS